MECFLLTYSATFMKNPLYLLLMAASVYLANRPDALADASVTPATGGEAISADTAGAAYTSLVGPKLTETDKEGIGVGSIILNAPAGFEFNTAATVTVAVTGSRKGTDIVLSNTVATVTTNTITIYVDAISSPNPRRSTLTWSGIKVRPVAGFPLATGVITKTGTSLYGESGSAGNYGSLTTIPGVISGLVVALPGQTFSSGNGVSGLPSTQVAGIPFRITSLTAADRFMNVVTGYNGARNISYTGPGGTPSYTTNTEFFAGRSLTPLDTLLRRAETTTITASDGATTGPASSPLTVLSGPFSKLQILLPGETPDPGTPTGKTGSPLQQIAGSNFTVTVRAVDSDWNLVETATDTVALSATDTNASFPGPFALTAGTGTFSVVLRTAGTHVITAADITNASITPATSTTVVLAPASLQGLQILVPGETHVPGTPTGKTGVPAPQVAGMAFTVRLYTPLTLSGTLSQFRTSCASHRAIPARLFRPMRP